MLARIRLLCILTVVLDMLLLALMVHYTSWLCMLGFVSVSGLIGAWLIHNGAGGYLRKAARSASCGRTGGGEVPLLGAAARLVAGVLFIVPGVLTDIMGLVLISPWGKWLLKSMVESLSGKMLSRFADRGRSARANEEKSAKDEIIDVRVVDGGETDEANQQ
jgi:UPF0716 protein FxsA